MKKILLSMLSLAIIVPIIVFADGVPAVKITLEQKGEFKSVAYVEQNDFAVPTMIDVPIEFNKSVRFYALVTDSTGAIVSSTVINKSQKSSITFGASDSFENSNANNMVDGDQNTFTEFPFAEEKYVGGENSTQNQNTVIIDVKSDRAFRADSMNIKFDKNIQKPTRIRVVAVKKDEIEQILLPEQFFGQNTVNFPEVNTDHYRITLHYIKPLRISEIMFYEKDVPLTIEQFVRFIAQPKMAYDIYYNTDEYVTVDSGETPNFSTKEPVIIVQPTSTKNNPLYKKADTDEDGVVDSSDNCVGVANSDQVDKNDNNVGDACEDFDRDGVINVRDNCETIANRAQIDTDHDGIGDKCDSEESRFIEKYPWIPYSVLAIVFFVVAILIVKTIKRN